MVLNSEWKFGDKKVSDRRIRSARNAEMHGGVRLLENLIFILNITSYERNFICSLKVREDSSHLVTTLGQTKISSNTNFMLANIVLAVTSYSNDDFNSGL